MDVAQQAELFEQAVDAARVVSADAQHDGVFAPLVTLADDAPEAIGAAFAWMASDDPLVRATACDLVGLICERNEAPRESALESLLGLMASESDGSVHWSATRALGATASSGALPALVALVHHPDKDVRLQVAVAIPACLGDDVDPSAVAALIDLTNDRDAGVRNWATFGLGRQLATDRQDVRDALWARVTDESQDVREEVVAGLARRRDPRSLPLLTRLLEAGDVPPWLFGAAASLADSSLVPVLREYDQGDELVRRALALCDPDQRAARERRVAALVEETQRLLDVVSPGSVMSAWCDRLDVDILVSVREGESEKLGSADQILAAAGDEPAAAARRWVDLVTSEEEKPPE